ncbi:GNAT family N-acetyltransferase [Vibrio coralliilyticus]|uniref:GNAT family N-acetyltransferase n=1 Tax=Vibrio coralliilyticus TaxID=190893 RepID=UPI0015618F8D|nr:GNAT family N-acetyltransferase [Vibrio coralliilyticus]NRF25675.1 GNAT family N-acetyltransferase [Vibrio coralliilyticus]NRF79697.1 GNAT family N-acetyltransferase [Vibrio coralliilyticus]
MKLIPPSSQFKEAFARFYQDFKHNDPENADYYAEGENDIERYVSRLSNESLGIDLKPGYVPCSHFWLIDENQSIRGAIRIRHHIENEFLSSEAGHIGYDIAPNFRGQGNGKMMLKLALAEARKLGISKALVTADDDNWPSRKVIEANGGQLENIIMGKVFPNLLARYWIQL